MLSFFCYDLPHVEHNHQTCLILLAPIDHNHQTCSILLSTPSLLGFLLHGLILL
jgi:hypothetical protein